VENTTIKLVTGYRIPILGFGTYRLVGRHCKDAVSTALKLGYTHVDTAWIYENQLSVSNGIAASGVPREKLFITTKAWYDHLDYANAIEQCNDCLRQLRTDYIDLYLIHWPNKNIPMKDTFRALGKMVQEKKVRSIGVSNFSIRHLEDAIKVSPVPIAVNQVEFHPGLFQKELLDFCKEHNIVVTAYSPFGQGELFSNTLLMEIAKKKQKSVSQICLRWLHQHGAVVIPKATSEEHIKENMDFFSWSLLQSEVQTIDQLGNADRIVNPSFGEF